MRECVMFIPHEMILKIFRVIYYCFHISSPHTQKRHVMSFIVCGSTYTHLNSRMSLPIFLENHKYVFPHNTAMQSENRGEMKNFLYSFFSRLLQTHKSPSHVLRNCCSCSFIPKNEQRRPKCSKCLESNTLQTMMKSQQNCNVGEGNFWVEL